MREVSLRELVNYVRVAGGYAGYTDAERAVRAVLGGVSRVTSPSEWVELVDGLPTDVRGLWQVSSDYTNKQTKECPSDEAQDSNALLQAVCCLAGYSDESEARQAVLAVFGALKEKLQERVAAWAGQLPQAARSFWERARTIDEHQEAYQCL